MPWPFSRELKGRDAVLARQVIVHLQTQIAFQQLGTETYGTGLSLSSTSVNPGDGVSVRGIAAIVDSELVAKHLVPAAKQKVNIGETMLAEHQDFHNIQTANKKFEAYDKWTEFLAIYLERAKLQFKRWVDFVEDPSRFDVPERLTTLDHIEDVSMTVSATALNSLIKRAGLEGEHWLSINCSAFNDVRSRIGLPAFTDQEFQERFFTGMAGEPTTFFS